MKLRNGITKYILRKSANSWLPTETVNRPKGPILVPIDKCFDKRFKEAIHEYLSETRIKNNGYYDYKEIDRLLTGLDKNPFLYQRQIFALLSLEIWNEVYSV